MQNAVHWFTALWQAKCGILSTLKEKEQCKLKQNELKWVISQQAIEDYSAGVTEQRPEWWTLVNMWADYGYECGWYSISNPSCLHLEVVAKSLIPHYIGCNLVNLVIILTSQNPIWAIRFETPHWLVLEVGLSTFFETLCSN